MILTPSWCNGFWVRNQCFVYKRGVGGTQANTEQTVFLGDRTRNYKVEEGQCNTGATKYFITRADVAEFMLHTLKSDEYSRKGFAIAGLPWQEGSN